MKFSRCFVLAVRHLEFSPVQLLSICLFSLRFHLAPDWLSHNIHVKIKLNCWTGGLFICHTTSRQ